MSGGAATGGSGTSAIAGDLLFAAAERPGESAEAVVALDLGTGRERGRFVSGGGLGFGLVVAEGVVSAGGDLEQRVGPDRKSGAVYALDVGTGRERWRVPMGAVLAPPAVVGASVYGADWEGRLDAVGGSAGRTPARGDRVGQCFLIGRSPPLGEPVRRVLGQRPGATLR